MKLAIHSFKSGWSTRWIEYCKINNIQFLLINCYDYNIIQQLKDEAITHLMWHFDHSKPSDILMARNILFSVEKMGIKPFPNFNTSWHFDDKITQKYLLEAIDAKIVPSYPFYDKKIAIEWLKVHAKYPLVVKLRRGAGSYNVKLLKNYKQAEKYTNKMFSTGLDPSPSYFADIKNKIKISKNFQGFMSKLKKLPGFFKMVRKGKLFPKELGYVYFQEFIDNNKHDIRVSVIGGKAWAFKRRVRDNDFRASGSGMIDYSTSDIPLNLIETSFKYTQKIGAQSIAYDYVKNSKGEYLLVEISYGFSAEAIFECQGYWNKELIWNSKKLCPAQEVLKNFIEE